MISERRQRLPLVSVLMPIRDEARSISRSLGAVLAQDYPSDRLEVIVADGMSTDGTRQMVQALESQHSNLRMVNNAKQIVSTGLNTAMAVARGEIIVRVDGHCEVAPDYVRKCVEHLLTDGIDGVGGTIETLGETDSARVIAAAMASTFGVGGAAFRTMHNQTLLVDTVPFPAYTRAVIERVGPYDEELVRNQDDEYNCRLRGKQGKLLLAADLRSRYYSRSTFRSLGRQYFQYGYWKIRVMQKHPRLVRWRHLAPLALVSTLLVCLLGSLFSTGFAWAGVLLAGSYIITSLAASLAASHRSWLLKIQLPRAFAIMHFGYGLGSLLGLVTFWNRWGDHQTQASPSPSTIKEWPTTPTSSE